jgi:hypothetical protein
MVLLQKRFDKPIPGRFRIGGRIDEIILHQREKAGWNESCRLSISIEPFNVLLRTEYSSLRRNARRGEPNTSSSPTPLIGEHYSVCH